MFQVPHQLFLLTTAQQRIFQVVLKVNLIRVLLHIIKVPLCKEEILGLVQEINMTEGNFQAQETEIYMVMEVGIIKVMEEGIFKVMEEGTFKVKEGHTAEAIANGIIDLRSLGT